MSMFYESDDRFFDACFDERMRCRRFCNVYCPAAARDFRSMYCMGGEL